mgnify:FL=1|tara:strand:+ start:54 stop:572 length:519 start_codon:yes stop_codon:yes gene_type:complete
MVLTEEEKRENKNKYNRKYHQMNKEKIKERKTKDKECNPEKHKECANKSYHKNKTPERLKNKKEYEAEKRKDPVYAEFSRKRSRINTWKKNMKYWGTWEELNQKYMETICCPLCDCVMNQANNRYQKSVDHDHFSLYVRDIICKNCNNKRGKIDRNKMFLHLELYRYFALIS